jgi:glycosyltransferase involved in cell wall biosynthesis
MPVSTGMKKEQIIQKDRLSIIVILPYVDRFEGSKLGFAIASALSFQGHEVSIVIYECRESLIPDIERNIGNSKLHIIKKSKKLSFGLSYAFKYGYTKFSDKKITEYIKKNNLHAEIVLVVANEGLNIAKLLHQDNGNHFRTMTCFLLQDPPLNHLLFGRELKLDRTFLKGFFFYLNRGRIRKQLEHYDVLFSNSFWTKQIVEYIFNVQIKGVLNAVLLNSEPMNTYFHHTEPYIVVPTVALDSNGEEIVKKLASSGINLKTYGRKKILKDSMGYLETEKMNEVISNAEAMLFLFDYEGLGLIPLESLMLGTPVITQPKLAPFSELADNPNVIFFDDYSELEETCRKVLSGEKIEIVRKSCSDSVSRFKPIISANILAEQYKNFLREKEWI